jgi:hypothetical protein
LLALAASAQAAASSVIPADAQRRLKSFLEQTGGVDLAYVPTYAPAHFSYATSGGSPSENYIVLADQRYQANSPNRRFLEFTVHPFKGKLAGCAKGNHRTTRIDGKTVYLNSSGAWRCLRAPSGHLVRVKAVGVHVAQQALGTVVASAKRIP